MFRPRVTIFILVVVGLGVIAPLGRAQQAEPSAAEAKQAEREAMYRRYLEFPSYVKGGTIQPHWMADGSSFWYAEGTPANTVIYKVDPVANTKEPLFDTARLRQALTEVLGHEPPYQGLPFEEFTFVDKSEKAVKFTVEGKEFILQLDTYAITGRPKAPQDENNRFIPQRLPRPYLSWIDAAEELSPDRRWFATIKDRNLWLRSTEGGNWVQLTRDGEKDHEWDVSGAQWLPKEHFWKWTWWSPDSSGLAIKKVDYRNVPKIPVVDYLGLREKVEWVIYPKAGEPHPETGLYIVHVRSRRVIAVNIGDEREGSLLILGWQPDGSELLFFKFDRWQKKLDLMVADPNTGATRVILTETQEPFLPVHVWWGWSEVFTLLTDLRGFILRSERDGWNHLYLYDLNGNLIRRLTEGAWPVLRVVAVDEKGGWVYFIAQADAQRPYDTHLYRVDLEGKNFKQLTQAPGQHSPFRLRRRRKGIEFSPSKEFFLDTHSSVHRPPAVELRRADGTLLQTLSKANIDALISELKWRPPEEFVVKAADGETDLYGILYKPYDFNPNKKYPVIEMIYAGSTYVPRSFRPASWPKALAQLGFIVFIVDGRGTGERGKEFRDLVYGKMGRYEIPDHVATLKQLAAKRPYMDLSRVGVFGYSWGGYFALRALLQAPEVYQVGVASAPITDMAEHWGNDLNLGPPQENKEGYEFASNLRLAGNLKGKLLLVHGTSDRAVPFSHTMKMVEALIRAGKPFDLIVLPEQGHGLTGASRTYAREAYRRYFQQHLKP